MIVRPAPHGFRPGHLRQHRHGRRIWPKTPNTPRRWPICKAEKTGLLGSTVRSVSSLPDLAPAGSVAAREVKRRESRAKKKEEKKEQ